MVDAAALEIRRFDRVDTENVVRLWQDAGLVRPWNDPRRDIERKLKVMPELFVVGITEGKLVASAMGGYDGHRGWVYYLAVSPACQGCGYGRRMMAYLEDRLLKLGCPKINLQVRLGNNETLKFYDAIGYALEENRSLGKRLIPDD